MNWEVSGRKQPWHNTCGAPEFAWRKYSKLKKMLARIASVPAQI
jgi:hypothetical protein